MEFKDVASHLLERSNAMQAFWGYYITISLALIAFFGSAARTTTLAGVLSLAFLVVAVVNLGGLSAVARQRLAFRELLQTADGADAATTFRGPLPSPQIIKTYLDNIHPPPLVGVVVTHLCCDVVVLASIWVLTCRAGTCLF